jgi:hypothetical protein
MRYQLRYVRETHAVLGMFPLPVVRAELYPTREPSIKPGLPPGNTQVRSVEIKCVRASSTSTQRCSLPGTTTS